MIIFPAIDIKGGKCVRLLKGDFNKVTQYEKSPVDQANEFSDLGFNNIHLIDLDGVLAEKPINQSIIKEISKIKKIKIQIGGGIRSLEHIKKLLDLGIDKVILGTAAIENINFLRTACEKFNDKIALSIDVRKNYIALAGWKKQTNILASDFIKKIKDINISRIIYTDINKDGTGEGPNLQDTINLSTCLFHFSDSLILVNAPRQPFLLSYSIRPCLNESVAIFCKLILIGVLIFNPCL